MRIMFDKWTLLKLIEVALCVACLTAKRVTDDEAFRLFLYLQKLSREWSLLNNVTWSSVGTAIADATYGGYVIITCGLLIGRLVGELPTQYRVTEYVLLGLGAFLFIVLGSLEYAAIDSVPADLVDNAAILGTLTIVTAILFLLDLSGPKRNEPSSHLQQQKSSKVSSKPIQTTEPDNLKHHTPISVPIVKQSHTTHSKSNGMPANNDRNTGKDEIDSGIGGETETTTKHSPVWEQVRKGIYGRYELTAPRYHAAGKDVVIMDMVPEGPGDPGYVQYTAQNWGHEKIKSRRSSPTDV